MSSKKCDHYGADCERHRFYRRLFGALLFLLVLILLTILIVWLVLRPTKPNFYLRDVNLSQFNVTGAASVADDPFSAPAGSSSRFMTVAAQVTLSSKNPNDRIGVYYDRMDVYAVYKGQQVTVPTGLPQGYQGHQDIAVWSPNLWGTAVPVAQFLADSLAQDMNAGVLLVDFRIGGRLRWKVGTWTSGTYHLYVNCPAFLTTTPPPPYNNGGYRLQQGTVTCSVDTHL